MGEVHGDTFFLFIKVVFLCWLLFMFVLFVFVGGCFYFFLIVVFVRISLRLSLPSGVACSDVALAPRWLIRMVDQLAHLDKVLSIRGLFQAGS